MEANNGYEYRVLKVRGVGPWSKRATRRAVERAAAEGWEIVHTFTVTGFVTTPAVTLRRPLGGRSRRAAGRHPARPRVHGQLTS